jgi:hypothetical protein
MGFLPTHCSNTQSSPAGEKRMIQIQSQFYGDCRKCVILQCQTGNDKAGIPAFQQAIFKVGAHVQERHELKERPLRVGIIGYPYVGKVILMGWCIVWWIHSSYSHTHTIYISPSWFRTPRQKDTNAKALIQFGIATLAVYW